MDDGVVGQLGTYPHTPNTGRVLQAEQCRRLKTSTTIRLGSLIWKQQETGTVSCAFHVHFCGFPCCLVCGGVWVCVGVVRVSCCVSSSPSAATLVKHEKKNEHEKEHPSQSRKHIG